MKNNVIKKAVYAMALLLVFSFNSCDSDDDLPSGPAISVNSFCYGLDSLNSFESTAAFNGDLEEVRPGVFRTVAFITDENITVDAAGDFIGAGVIMDVVLFGNRDVLFQTGTYLINSNQEVGSAFVSYDIDYDDSNAVNRGTPLSSGFVSVTPFRGGYAIEIDGEDLNGDRFHGIYLGSVTPL